MRVFYWCCRVTGMYGYTYYPPGYSKIVMTRKEWLTYKNKCGILPPDDVGEPRS